MTCPPPFVSSRVSDLPGPLHDSLADVPRAGIKAKVENRGQYEQYLEELKPLREELGVPLAEDMYPEQTKWRGAKKG